MPDLAELMLVVNSNQVTVANGQMNIMVGVAGKAEVAIKGVGSASDRTNASFAEMTKMMTALTAGYLSFRTVQEAVSTAFTEDRLQKGFTNILQDATKAQKVLAELEEFSKSSQFEFVGVADAAREFMSLGLSAERSVEIVKTIGQQIQTIGGGASNIDSISRSFRLMEETGQANLFVFRSLAGQGIPAIQMLAKALGVDMTEAMRLLRAGAISGDDAVKVLTAGMQKNIANAKDTQATYTQLWQQLKNVATLGFGDLAKSVLDAAKTKDRLSELVLEVRFLFAVVSDTVRVMMGLPTHFKSTETAAGELAAVLRVLLAIFELIIALKMVKWATDLVVALPKLTMAIMDMTVGGKAAIIVLAAITGIELGRWASDNYKPVAELFAKVTATLGLIKGATNFIGEGIGDTIGSFMRTGGMPGGLGNGDADRLTGGFANNFDKVMKDYDKAMADIASRPDQTDPNKTNPLKYMMMDLSNLQKQVQGYMSGALDMKMPSVDQFRKEVQDFQTGLSGGGDVKIQAQIRPELDAQLQRTIDRVKEEAKLVGMVSEERDKQLKILQMQETLVAHGIDPNRADAQAYIKQLDQAITRLNTLKQLDDVAKGMGSSFAGAFGSFISGAKNASQAAKQFVTDLSQMLMKKLVLDKLANLIEGGVMGIGQGLMGGGSAPYLDSGGNAPNFNSSGFLVDPSGFNAKGNAFWNGFKTFAMGGVVNSPTAFGMRGGLGLMGEAGPEAIVPLKRGSDGKLGVSMDGAGSSTVVNHYHNWNISSPNADSFRRSSRQVAAMAQRAVGGR